MSNPIKPEYYKPESVDPIEYAFMHGLDHCSFTAIKYLTRAGKKDPAKHIQDLDKAIEFIERLKKEIIKRQKELIHP